MDDALRRQVRDRANDTCEYCRLPQQFDVLPFQIDHIIAVKHAGPTTASNLALSCFNCNAHKGSNIAGIDPEMGALTPLFHPRHDNWQDHFAFRDTSLVGNTAIGRTTIVVLDINRPERIEHRRLLIEAGAFSP